MEKYEELEMETICFDDGDMITCSDPNDEGDE